MADVIVFPDLAARGERRIPAIIETMTRAGVKGVDEAWARTWIEAQQVSELRVREQVAAGMSREGRLDDLARRLAATIKGAPRVGRSEEEQRVVRERLEREAETDPIARLALEISERIGRVAKAG